MNKLEKAYNTIYNKYGGDRIVFATELETIIIFVLPSENQLYTATDNIYLEQGVIDFRNLLNISTIYGITALFKKTIINTKYRNLLLNNIICDDRKEIENAYALSNKQNLKENMINIFQFYLKIKTEIKQEELSIKLTKTEKKALYYIVQEFKEKNEGDISILQLVEKSKISRPIFISLFYKLKDSKLAEIDSRGVKGTHIVFKYREAINTLIDFN